MTAPSNANTSGLSVVAWRYRTAPHRDWHETECSEVARVEEMDGSEVEPLHVTAASAQTRIAELERALEKTACDFQEAAEAHASEKARADRLAKALEPFAVEHECDGHSTVEDFNMEVQVSVRWAIIKAARAALQQETQP